MDNGVCPSDYFCSNDGWCHLNGTSPTASCAIDARPDSPKPIDAPRPDADMTPPAVLATLPADGATGVPVASNVRVQFNEPVFNVTTTTFRVLIGAQVPGTIASIDPLNVVFTPTGTFPANTTVAVQLTSGIMDANGNMLVPTSFSFTTAP
jgi:hypothetical protein